MTRDASRPRTDRRPTVGRLGEDLAADHLRDQGWVILDRNWRNRYGELDLIGVDADTLVIVEVKTRASRYFVDPVAAVTPDKLARMRRLTRMWLAEQETSWPRIRFDIVSVQLDPADPADSASARVRHHRAIVE